MKKLSFWRYLINSIISFFITLFLYFSLFSPMFFATKSKLYDDGFYFFILVFMAFGLIGFLFFSPVLLLAVLIKYLFKPKISNILNFLFLELYGYILFVYWPTRLYVEDYLNLHGYHSIIDLYIQYLVHSISSTLLFLLIWNFIDSKKYLKVVNFLFKKNKQ